MSEFDLTLGIMLIGIFLNTFLYGIVVYQFIRYHIIQFNDPRWLRTFVFFLFLIDTAHSASIVYMAYHFCVTHYGKPESLAYAPWPYPFTSVSCAVIAFMTHLFLTRRIFVLTKNKYISGTLAFISFACFAVGFSAGIRAWTMPTFAEMVVLIPQVTAWFSMSFSLDLILAAILIWTLKNSRTGITNTDTMLTRLMKGAISTGIFAAMFNMGALLSFRFAPSTNFAAFFADPMGRVYTNTLMATLLDREDLKRLLNWPLSLDSVNPQTNSTRFARAQPAREEESMPMQPIYVKKEVFGDRSDGGNETMLMKV